ncbi:MAG: HPr family phosphocarrier protein [Oscillospiraceae bacterium]|nr:HPr family phosphocarrier protein [Oscillospiraceae bacterium]
MQIIKVMDKNGLHARPASKVVSIAKNYQGEVFLQKGEQKCNAKSIMLIMGLDLMFGDVIEVSAIGDGSEEIELAIKVIIESPNED